MTLFDIKDVLKGIIDFFTSIKSTVTLKFTDENNKTVKKTIPSLNTIKNSIKQEILNEIYISDIFNRPDQIDKTFDISKDSVGVIYVNKEQKDLLMYLSADKYILKDTLQINIPYEIQKNHYLNNLKYYLFIEKNHNSFKLGIDPRPIIHKSIKNLGKSIISKHNDYKAFSGEIFPHVYNLWKIFDYDSGTYAEIPCPGEYVEGLYKFNSKHKITRYSVLFTEVEFMPDSITLLGSDDGTKWDVLDYQTDIYVKGNPNLLFDIENKYRDKHYSRVKFRCSFDPTGPERQKTTKRNVKISSIELFNDDFVLNDGGKIYDKDGNYLQRIYLGDFIYQNGNITSPRKLNFEEELIIPFQYRDLKKEIIVYHDFGTADLDVDVFLADNISGRYHTKDNERFKKVITEEFVKLSLYDDIATRQSKNRLFINKTNLFIKILIRRL